jgi:stage V sporulation protein S
MEILKVASNSNPNSVAGALTSAMKEHVIAEIQAVGAGAVNQSIKAIAIARGFMMPIGYELSFVPAFVSLNLNGEDRTAIKLIVHKTRIV